MKKTLSLAALCVLLFISKPSSAQKGFDFGINSGLQTTTLINQKDQAAGEELNYKQKIGVPLGVGCGYSFSNRLGVGIDVIYARQGQSYVGQIHPSTDPQIYLYQVQRLAAMDNIPLPGSYTADVLFSCVKVPLMFRYTSNAEKTVFFSSFIGPQLTMLNSVTLKINEQEVPLAGTGITQGDLYKKMLIDGVMGLGAGCNVTSNIVVTAQLRLEYSLSDAENKSATFTYQGQQQKYYTDGRGTNHSASGGLMVGVHYRIAKEKVYFKPQKKYQSHSK